jgi:hypothetical protein
MPPLDKPESLFTIAGYSFVAFFLPANVDSFCRHFNLQSSMATFVAFTRSYPRASSPIYKRIRKR